MDIPGQEEIIETPQITVTGTMDISVKTLDSRTHQFNDLDIEITVPGFKAHISETVGVPSEQQRLIFRGRVLQDDKKLKDYNVASGQVIHLVTRTSASTANHTPPPPNVSGGQSIMMGQLGSMDFPGSGVTQSTVRRRNSAAVRLQVANENMTRASGMLKTLEEDIVLLEQQSNSNQESQGRETPSFSDELDNALNSTLGGPTAAALVATISESQGGSTENTQGQQAGNQPRLPAPMLQELSTSIEDYLNINSRLVPFLQTLQRWLRENTELAESQRDQVQYTYDTLSAVLHSLSHTLHAMSDITIDFSLSPENRRLRAPPSILVGQSTVVRAAIPIGIGIEGLPIQVTSTSTSSVNLNPSVTVTSSQNSGNQNSNQPTSTPTFQGGNIQFPAGFSFGPGMVQGANVQISQGLPQGANVQFNPSMSSGQGANVQFGPIPFGPTQNRPQGMGGLQQGMGGLQQAIAAALQAFGTAGARPQGGGVMLGPFSTSVPTNPNVRVAPPATASGQPNSNTPGTASANTGSITTSAQTQGSNAAQDHFRSLLGSLSPQHRPYDLLLQCRSHHHLRSQENRQERPNGLVSFLSEQRTDKKCRGAQEELEDDNRILQTFFGLVQVVNPLRPVLAQYIRSTLLRGRDPNNRSHVSTAVRFHARRLVTWLTEPLRLTNDEGTMNKLSQDLIEVLTEFFSQCVEVILIEPTDSNLLTSHFARLIGEQMPRIRSIMQEAFGAEGYPRVLRGLVLMGINALFPQSSLMFRTQITRAVSGILETINYIPDDGDDEPEEEQADMEIDIDVRIDDQSENGSYQEARTSPLPMNNINAPPQPQSIQPDSQVTLTNQIPVNDEIHSESDVSDLETELEAARAELFQNAPDAWRNTLFRDLQRQEQLREAGPEPLSNEYVALFQQK